MNAHLNLCDKIFTNETHQNNNTNTNKRRTGNKCEYQCRFGWNSTFKGFGEEQRSAQWQSPEYQITTTETTIALSQRMGTGIYRQFMHRKSIYAGMPQWKYAGQIFTYKHSCPGNSILSMFVCVCVFEAAIFIEKINNSRSKVAMSKENRVLLFAVLFLFWFVFFSKEATFLCCGKTHEKITRMLKIYK